MNKLFPLLFLYLIHFTHSFAQDEITNYSFNHLDSLCNRAKIIGAGESTHGTSEFSQIRLELLNYLVVNHNFNTFFLEADFSACQRVNRYINGEEDSVQQALSEIRLWPWLTLEMIEIIEWCRTYNSQNQNRISFVGCDMQMVIDDNIELKRITDTIYSNTIDSIFVNLRHTASFSFIENRYKRWIDFKSEISRKEESLLQSFDYNMICITVDQWFESILGTGIKYNFRDSCMAVNMMNYFGRFPSSKGLYFAHNWHVSNTTYAYKTMWSTKTTGAFLKASLHEQYIPMAIVAFDVGFNALTCADGTFKMKAFSLRSRRRRDLEHLFSVKTDHLINTFYSSNIPDIEKYYITDIGAIYEKDCDNVKPGSKRRLKSEMFEVFLFIKKGTRTKFIDTIQHRYTSNTN